MVASPILDARNTYSVSLLSPRFPRSGYSASMCDRQCRAIYPVATHLILQKILRSLGIMLIFTVQYILGIPELCSGQFSDKYFKTCLCSIFAGIVGTNKAVHKMQVTSTAKLVNERHYASVLASLEWSCTLHTVSVIRALFFSGATKPKS